ncbi:ribonuclease Y [Microlunatus antarcticus]|uniref:Ribonuclease Y n=1 Tax=Microlunatus antarcticus TaxID=53388 RepID=A0A7W5JVH9_9ACTN|nr:ribonuclease Y [Microlunatus antarcticus]MBB3326537.1 ribonuclease Y [Microlunatus antarcticus]
MAGGAFQALVLVLLLIVVAVVGVVAVVLLRRSRTSAVRVSSEAPVVEPRGLDDTAAQTAVTPTPTSSALTSPSAATSSASTSEPDPDSDPDAESGAPHQAAAPEPVKHVGPPSPEAAQLVEQANERAAELMASVAQARAAFEEQMQARRDELRAQRVDVERREHRLTEREERLDGELRSLNDQLGAVDATRAELDERRGRLDEAEVERLAALERVAGLTAEQAKSELVAGVEHDAKRQSVLVAREIERKALREADERARNIVVGAIQRVASDQTSESVVSAVHLPGDEMKGRIIGREGRNIRAFEQVTGVNVMIDDTPESVLLSCFDPVRRETARLTLTELVKDGRIHPARIEEVHERSRGQIEALCLQAAEDAMADVGITDLHPALVSILGTLRYRTSYGQNVLKHMVESAHLAGLMAGELGLDIAQCKRSAFLHDIGKALTHEVEGSHAMVGADLARRYGENADVVHAIEAHHNEVEVRTVEAVLTQAADAISGGRPGARRETLEAYVQRLEKLEQIAGDRDGVEKVFAMQAGREIRVMVAPEEIDDIAAQVLARDIAKQIEEDLTYPGQIKVVVVRESRATETAR